jgi:hypothetical protein
MFLARAKAGVQRWRPRVAIRESSVVHQAADAIATRSPQADHAELHFGFLKR